MKQFLFSISEKKLYFLHFKDFREHFEIFWDFQKKYIFQILYSQTEEIKTLKKRGESFVRTYNIVKIYLDDINM